MHSRAACWHAAVVHCSSTTGTSGTSTNRGLDFPFQECMFFISSGNRVATPARARIHSVDTCLSLTVSATRGTAPLTLVTARHDRIPSQPYGHFLVWKAPQVGGSRMAGARQPQGRVRLRVALVGLEFCGRSLRHRQVHIHQVRMRPNLDCINDTAFF